MAKKAKMIVESGRSRLYDSSGVRVDMLIMNDKTTGVQLSWKGRIITLWEDGSLGVCGQDLSSHLYVR